MPRVSQFSLSLAGSPFEFIALRAADIITKGHTLESILKYFSQS